MGVPGYFAAARRVCPSAVVGVNRDRSVVAVPAFDSLYVDFNCVVHHAVGTASRSGLRDDGSVLDHTVLALEHIIDDVSPSRAVYVCADGVPPEAKMAQQRNRRFMACKRGDAGNPDVFDRNKITPGTQFNALLDARMKRECERLAAARGLEVAYSGTDSPGEGEQKIMAMIRAAWEGGGAGAGAACAYGLDADLVLLCGCLAAQGAPVPWLCREEKEISDGLTFVDARRLACGMAGGDSPRALWNHVVCSFFCGNDFLPPLSCLGVSRETGWLMRLRSLCDSRGVELVREGELSWPDLERLLSGLSQTEDADFAKADSDFWSAGRPRVSQPSDAWDNYPVLNKPEGLRAIRPGEPDWRARYYSLLFGFRNNSGVNRVVGEYVRGLSWTFEYYRGSFPPPGQAPAWYYRYQYGPTSLDVFNAVAASPGRPASADLSGLDTTPVSPDRLIRFVTPLASGAILPDPDEPREPAHLFPHDCAIASYLKRKVWDCRAVLPPGSSSDVVVRTS